MVKQSLPDIDRTRVTRAMAEMLLANLARTVAALEKKPSAHPAGRALQLEP